MTSPVIDFPVFDADNHMYETTDAFTKFLRQVRGPDRVRRGRRAAPRSPSGARSASTSPTPRSTVVAAPGAQEEYFKNGNPEGRSRREIMGKPIRALRPSRIPSPGSC